MFNGLNVWVDCSLFSWSVNQFICCFLMIASILEVCDCCIGHFQMVFWYVSVVTWFYLCRLTLTIVKAFTFIYTLFYQCANTFFAFNLNTFLLKIYIYRTNFRIWIHSFSVFVILVEKCSNWIKFILVLLKNVLAKLLGIWTFKLDELETWIFYNLTWRLNIGSLNIGPLRGGKLRLLWIYNK